MTEDNKRGPGAEVDLEDMVASSDSGAQASGNAGQAAGGHCCGMVALSTVDRLSAAVHPGFGVFNATEARSIHLAFALLLAYMAYPALKRSPRNRIPLMDWGLAILAAAAAAYTFVFYDQLSQRPGADPAGRHRRGDRSAAVARGHATRLGPPLTIIASIFIIYSWRAPGCPASWLTAA